MRRETRVRLGIGTGAMVALCLLGLLALTHGGPGWRGRSPCPATESVVQIDTSAHVLSLCRAGREEATFRVALGRGGVGKRVEGDERTPLGRYPLAPARASDHYYKFLHIGYPTAEQARRGWTGGAIGIHGPPLPFEWAGDATTIDDWTLGCVALPNRKATDTVAAWVDENKVSEVVIH